MQNHDGHEEQRRYPRVSEHCTVHYRTLPGEKVVSNGRHGETVNISGGGICFETSEEMPEGGMVVLEIDLPNFPSSVVALGRVVWSRLIAGSGAYETGLEFWWVGWREEDAQQSMLDYIKKKLQEGF